MRHYWLFLVLLLVACQPADRQAKASTSPTSGSIQLGQTVYSIHCASCHGANLEGETNWKEQNEDSSFRAPPHDESGHTWHHGDTTLLEAIRLGGSRFDGIDIGGTSNMPAFQDVLSEEEMTAVLVYIKSTWSTDMQTYQLEMTQRETQSTP